jgi:hypothetical protein
MENNFTRTFDESKLFAFAEKPVTISATSTPVNLFAYVETPKQATNNPGGTKNNRSQNKPLQFSTNLEGTSQDLLGSLQLSFDRPINRYDSNKIILTNNQFVRQANYSVTQDSLPTFFTIKNNWTPNTEYNLILAKDAFIDSTGATLAKADTITFRTKKEEDYGTVKIRFNNLDVSKNPVLHIVQNDAIVRSAPLTQRDYVQRLFKPGEFELRILYDANKNGKWDPGEFLGKRKQPEIVINLQTTLSVRANWDNEKEISLQ